MDWEEWMKKNHIKLRGDPNGNRGSDENNAGRRISGTEVASEVHDDARKTGDSHIQKPVRKGQTQKEA